MFWSNIRRASFVVVITASALLAQSPDPSLARYIDSIRAIDDHAHVMTADPADQGYDQLPCDHLPDEGAPTPVMFRYQPEQAAALSALYGFAPADLGPQGARRVDEARAKAIQHHNGDAHSWVLQLSGIETVIANRTSMPAELKPPQFRWVPYLDSLMYPLDNEHLKSLNPDRRVLFGLVEKMRAAYLQQAGVHNLPATLDEYLDQVVRPTLQRQRAQGAVAIKFEAAYLRSLNFTEGDAEDRARQIYARYASGGTPSDPEYKILQDYLFRQLAIEAGRLGMAIQLHTGTGCGAYFNDAGANAMLLETAINDPALRKTRFMLLHGNRPDERAMMVLILKPNVYTDTSVLEYFMTLRELADLLKVWLAQVPEHVLFGTDAGPFGPGLSWQETTVLGAAKFRRALSLALTEMIADRTIDRPQAEKIAREVMHDNAVALYGLK